MMRPLYRTLCLCLALLLPVISLAEIDFFRHIDGWTLDETPLKMEISASVAAHMPFDEDRLAMLTAITDRLSLCVIATPVAGQLTIRVGMTDAFSFTTFGDSVQFSSQPGVAFTAPDGAAMELLTGVPTKMEIDLFGMRGDAETLLTNGWELLQLLGPALDEYADRRSVKTAISGMGTARSCTDYILPSGKADQLQPLLMELCPEGWLRDLLSGMTFSGKQTLRVYRTEDEVPLRMEYNGTCGQEGSMRMVKLVWRMKRTSDETKDEITLTSPAKTGTDKNTLEFERIVKHDDAKCHITGSFTYTVTSAKQTTTRSGNIDLICLYTDDTDQVQGSVTIRQKLPGESSFTGYTFAPDLKLSGTADQPDIRGTLQVTQTVGKGVTEDAILRIAVSRFDGEIWQASEQTVDLSALSTEALAQVQTEVSASVAMSIVRPLILLMGEDAQWFFRDLPQDAVDRIIEAAETPVFVN